MFSGTAHKFVVEVQPVGEGVDFQGGVGARGSGEHGVDVEVNGRTTAEEAGGRMADDVDVGVLDRGQQASGHLLAGLVEIGVHGSNQDVEPGEKVVVPIKGTVRGDVEFGPVEDRNMVAASRLGQLAALLEGLVTGHPLHRQQRRVIGDRAIAISMAGSGGDHVVQVGKPVGEIGMHMEIAHDVGHLHQVG